MLHGRLLRYLDEVARCQSIREAGARLNVASSAIGRQIIALEEMLGTKLFERRPLKVVLTAAGELVIDHVRRTLREMDHTIGQIEALKGLQKGEVRIGIASGVAGTIVPATLLRVFHAHKRVTVIATVMSTEDIASGLAAGDLDLGLGFDLPSQGLQVIAQKSAKLGAVVSADHPLAQRTSVTLAECAAYPLCVAQPPLTLRDRVEEAFRKASLRFEPAIETDSIELMRNMVLEEPFITFLTPYDINQEPRAQLFAHVPVERAFQEPEKLMLLGRQIGYSPLAMSVAEVCKTVLDHAG